MNNPELYQQSNEIHRKDIPEYLEKYASVLKWKGDSNKIIDIGCGDGSVTNLLKKFLPTNYKLLGCDISKNMVVFANDHYSNEHTSFIILDIASELPAELKGNFDHVFSFYTLNWVIDQRRAFENIYNLLSPEGECFMVLVANNAVFDVYRALSRSSKWNTWIFDVERFISPYHDSENPEKEISNLMEEIGFVCVDVQSEDKVFTFRDKIIRTKLMTAINPFEIPRNKCDDFMMDYLKELNKIERNHNLKSDKCSRDVTLHYKSVVMYGRKPSASKMMNAS